MIRNDQQILDLFNTDKQKAIDALFDMYYKPLVLLANAYLRNVQLSEDIVQEQFVKFWDKKLYKTINKSSLKNYLYTLVKNASLNYVQKKDVLNSAIDFPHYDIAEQEAKRIQDEGIKLIKEALDALPEKTREVVKCVFIQNMKYQEAAEELDISINTVKTQLKRGIAKLKDLLKDHRDLMHLFFL